MAENLFARLSSIVKPSTVTEIARLLGVSEQSVSRGLALSTAAAFIGLARKAADSDTLRQVIDTASATRGDAVVSALSAGQLTDPRSPLLSDGRRFLESVFGGSQPTLLNAIGRDSGLTSAAAAAVLPLGAQSLLGFLATRIRDEGMTPSSLAGFLKREAPEIRRAMPTALDDAVAQSAPVIQRTIEMGPVVAEAAAVRSRRSVVPWLLGAAAAVACAAWLASWPGRDAVKAPPAPSLPAVGTSGTLLGDLTSITLPDGTVLLVPRYGVEKRLLAFIQDSNRTLDTTTWFDFDRLLFDTGSARLQPESENQLRAVATVLKANPRVNVKIGGYTDNVGSPEGNLNLSRERATNVMNELVRMGVAPNRLEAEGYGATHPVGDNSTETGRAMNRRISMLVTQK